MAKVRLVPFTVNYTGKRDKGGQGGATIKNARIILFTGDIKSQNTKMIITCILKQ